MGRREVNLKILDILKEAVDKYPDWRFGQLLFNLDVIEHRIKVDDASFDLEIIDPFYTESKTILEKLEKWKNANNSA